MEVAKKLGTTQATISYYLHSKRGKSGIEQLKSKPQVFSIASEMAEHIAKDKYSLIDATLAFCRLCRALKGGEMMCELHRHSVSLPIECDVCAEEANK
jgi:predicted transcriptional regulator